MKGPTRLIALVVLSLGASAACTDVSTAIDMSCTTPSANTPVLTAGGPLIDVNVCVRAGGGSVSPEGTACTPQGTGTEICGFELTLSVMGGATLDAFTPAEGVVANRTGNLVRLNGVNPFGEMIPLPVGTARVRCASEPCSVVAQGRFVGASLSFTDFGPFTLAQNMQPPPTP